MLELEAGRGKFFPALAAVAPRAGGARARTRSRDRTPAGGDRTPRAVRHPLPRRDARAPGTVPGQAAREDRPDRPRSARRRRAEFAFKPPERTGRVVFELEHGRIVLRAKQLLDDAELWLERGEHVSLVGPNGAGKTTLIETLAGTPRARVRASSGPATTSRSASSPSTPRSSAQALRGPCSRPRSTPPG